jgi:N-hydroxyarylamine O-acetyltransferase
LELSAYLDRVGFEGEPAPDRATLEALCKRHLLSIPYENIDVQLERTLTTDPAAAYARIVGRGRRGGWCYEMNGVFGWALKEVGFNVTRLASGVGRGTKGDSAVGNHLLLRIDMEDGPLLADVGLANGPKGPYPLAEGDFAVAGLDYKLERLEGGYWRFHNHPEGMAPNFDFKPEPDDDETALSRACLALQTEANSPFRNNLICVRFTPEGENHLLGRALRLRRPGGTSERVLASADELVATLEADFGIVEPAVVDLWPKICARHEEVMAARAASEGTTAG